MLHWGGSEMKIDWKWLCVRFGLLMIEYNYPHTTNTFAKNGKSNIKTAKRFNRNLSEHAPNINGLNHLAAQLRNSFLCSTFIKKSIKRGSTTTGGRWKHTRNWKALSRYHLYGPERIVVTFRLSYAGEIEKKTFGLFWMPNFKKCPVKCYFELQSFYGMVGWRWSCRLILMRLNTKIEDGREFSLQHIGLIYPLAFLNWISATRVSHDLYAKRVNYFVDALARFI